MRKEVVRISPIVATMIAGSFLTVNAAVAQPADLNKQLAACAVIEGELERLDCFDRMTARLGLAGPQPLPTNSDGTGKWKISRDINPIDDSERVVLALVADSGRNSRGETVTFVARCQSNKTEAYINWNDYLGDDGRSVYSRSKYVTIRIGNADAQRQEWGVSTDSRATFAPGWAGDLLKQMAASDTFLAQVTPYSESPVTAIFDTRGMGDALKPLAEACDWR